MRMSCLPLTMCNSYRIPVNHIFLSRRFLLHAKCVDNLCYYNYRFLSDDRKTLAKIVTVVWHIVLFYYRRFDEWVVIILMLRCLVNNNRRLFSLVHHR